MILEAAVALSAFGLAGFILGSIFDYTGVAIIGAAMVLLVGAMITANGLEVKTGETQEQVDSNTTEVTNTYEPITTPARFPLGLLTMLFSAALMMQKLRAEGGL